MGRAVLHLVIPELLRLPPAVYESLDSSTLRRLTTALARADTHDGQRCSLEQQVAHLAGLSSDATRDLPVAALARLGERNVADISAACWLRCDPVHLHADRDQLLVFHPRALRIDTAEADALVAAINGHFQGDGWRLFAAHPERWYLALQDAPSLRTYDLAEVCGRPMRNFMPSGADARRWRSHSNELQMLLHGHGVNSAREQARRAAINGVWLWGVGSLPSSHSSSNTVWSRVTSDEPFARGVASFLGVSSQSMMQAVDSSFGDGDASLLVYSQLRDATLTADAADTTAMLSEAIDRYLIPALDALQRNDIAELMLYPCDGRAFSWTRASLRRFWRAGRAIDRWLLGA